MSCTSKDSRPTRHGCPRSCAAPMPASRTHRRCPICRIWASPPSNCCRYRRNRRNCFCRSADAPTTGDTQPSASSRRNPRTPPNARSRPARARCGRKSSTWCARCMRRVSKSSWTWSTTTPANQVRKGRRSAGADWTIWPTTDAPATSTADCTIRPAAATRSTSPTRMSPPSPWIHCAIGPSASASTDSASTSRPRWRASTATSHGTIRSCTRCVPTCCWATSSSSWSLGTAAPTDGRPDNSAYPSPNGTTVSATARANSGSPTWSAPAAGNPGR